MIFVIATAAWFALVLVAMPLALAAGRPTPAPPSSVADSPEDVKQPVTDRTGFTSNPAALNGA